MTSTSRSKTLEGCRDVGVSLSFIVAPDNWLQSLVQRGVTLLGGRRGGWLCACESVMEGVGAEKTASQTCFCEVLLYTEMSALWVPSSYMCKRNERGRQSHQEANKSPSELRDDISPSCCRREYYWLLMTGRGKQGSSRFTCHLQDCWYKQKLPKQFVWRHSLHCSIMMR